MGTGQLILNHFVCLLPGSGFSNVRREIQDKVEKSNDPDDAPRMPKKPKLPDELIPNHEGADDHPSLYEPVTENSKGHYCSFKAPEDEDDIPCTHPAQIPIWSLQKPYYRVFHEDYCQDLEEDVDPNDNLSESESEGGVEGDLDPIASIMKKFKNPQTSFCKLRFFQHFRFIKKPEIMKFFRGSSAILNIFILL